MAKIIEHVSNIVKLSRMKDGDVAEIVSWYNDEKNNGKIIQRHHDRIILIGEEEGKSYPTLLKSEHVDRYLVRILPPGTVIEL